MRIIDLSHHYADDMPVYPGLPSPTFAPIANVDVDTALELDRRLICR